MRESLRGNLHLIVDALGPLTAREAHRALASDPHTSPNIKRASLSSVECELDFMRAGGIVIAVSTKHGWEYALRRAKVSAP